MTQTIEQPGRWQTGTRPVFNAPASVLALIGVLVAIHAGLFFGGQNWQVESLRVFAFIPVRYLAAYGAPAGAEVWTFITYAFLHGDWTHLLFNCVWLLVFGTPVARYLGGIGFFLLCAVAAVGGAMASLLLRWGEPVIMIGASGAVSGLLAAAIPIIYGKRVPGGARPLSFGELLTSRRALGFMAVWLGVTLLSGASGWTGNSFMAEGGIAWEAHLGGFIGGLATFYALARRAVYFN